MFIQTNKMEAQDQVYDNGVALKKKRFSGGNATKANGLCCAVRNLTVLKKGVLLSNS
jgi:hypothetical protein